MVLCIIFGRLHPFIHPLVSLCCCFESLYSFFVSLYESLHRFIVTLCPFVVVLCPFLVIFEPFGGCFVPLCGFFQPLQFVFLFIIIFILFLRLLNVSLRSFCVSLWLFYCHFQQRLWPRRPLISWAIGRRACSRPTATASRTHTGLHSSTCNGPDFTEHLCDGYLCFKAKKPSPVETHEARNESKKRVKFNS